MTRPLTLGLVADARSALEGSGTRLRAMNMGTRDGARLARYRAMDEQIRAAQAEPIAQWQGPGIHPAHALDVVGRVFGSETIHSVNGGNTALWAFALLPATRPRSYVGNLELGMLGTGIPQAVGAKLGAPEREVVCVSGDGAAGFNIMEMQTAAQEGLAITTIIFAEGAWTMEEPNELVLYGRTFGTEQGEIRWDVVAQGLGCHGGYVDRLEDLEGALRRAARSGYGGRSASRPARPSSSPRSFRDGNGFARNTSPCRATISCSSSNAWVLAVVATPAEIGTFRVLRFVRW